jgi:hypothetical protein
MCQHTPWLLHDGFETLKTTGSVVNLQTIGARGEFLSFDLTRARSKLPDMSQTQNYLHPKPQKAATSSSNANDKKMEAAAKKEKIKYEEAPPFQPTPAESTTMPMPEVSIPESELAQPQALTSPRGAKADGGLSRSLVSPRSVGGSRIMPAGGSIGMGAVRELNGVAVAGGKKADDEVRVVARASILLHVHVMISSLQAYNQNQRIHRVSIYAPGFFSCVGLVPLCACGSTHDAHVHLCADAPARI